MVFQLSQRLPLLWQAARNTRRRFWLRGVRPTQGLPPALEFETLDALCQQRGIGRLRQSTHLHLSGWKSLGTYRLELITDSDAKWPLIFKDECYRIDLIPALEGLPVLPGQPEALIYGSGTTALSPFLPKLIWFREVEPRQHFQYLLEDLAQTHTQLKLFRESADYAAITRALIKMQKSFSKAFCGERSKHFINYDRSYSEGLLRYALASLSEYVSYVEDDGVESLLNRWRDVEFVHQHDEFYNDSPKGLIHGDFNSSNIHVERTNGTCLKVVDWEWAGIGVPHADLAALVKSRRREEQLALLDVFASEDERFDREQHRRLFYWCQLERRLQDAAYLAKQQMLSRRRVSWMPRAIRSAAKDVMTAVKSLQAPVT